MKKKLCAALCLVMICLGGLRAQSNLANYTFTSSVGSYTPLTGATTFANSWDDAISSAVPLGGTFTYGATTFTACYISTNGFITLGTTAPGSSVYTPVSTSGSYGVISALGADGASSTVSGASPLISYMNIGGATGEFVVEYKDAATYRGRSLERLNYQIRLNLATGAVNIVYGSWTAPGDSYNAEIGLRGSTNTFSNNINTLMAGDIPAGTTCSWANAVTSNANSGTMLFGTGNTAVVPSNGLTLSWNIPAVALAPVRTFTAVTGITQTSAVIGWTAPAGATQYNVKYRIPGTCAWTNFSGNPVSTNSATLTGLTLSTYYQVSVQSSDGTNNAIWSHIPDAAGTGNGYATTGTFKTLDPPCVVPTSQPTGLTFGGVTNSVINGTYTAATPTVSNYLVIRTLGPAPNTPTNGVTYTTGASVALGGTVVSVGTGTTFATSSGLTANTNYAYYVYAYNNTGCSGGPLYNTTAPLTGTVNTCPAKATAITSTLVTTGSFNLNWTASAGGTAIPITYSVEVSSNSAFTAPVAGSPFLVTSPTTSVSVPGLNQLTTYYYRITADNGCNIGATTSATVQTLPTCPKPTALSTSTITGSTANFTWTPGGSESAWDIYYGMAPLPVPNATTVPTATSSVTSYSATGLYSATVYTVYVRANCSMSDQSLWSAAKVFTTATTCTVPAGLGVTGITGTSANYTWTAGTGTAWDVYYGVAPLTVPTVTTAPTATTATNSYSATGLYSGTGYAVYVRANCGGGDVSNWTAVKNYTTTITCPVPTAVTVSGISNASATFSWTSTASAWDVYYGTATSVPSATTVPTATTAINSYTATGLTGSTGYSVYVRSECGAGDMSTWTAVKTFTTLCNPISSFPFTESFSATYPSCWASTEGSSGASYHWESVTADATNGVSGPQSGTNFMRLNVYNASTTYNTYNLTTPAFALPATAKQVTYSYFLGTNGYKGTTGTTGTDPYPLALQISTDFGATWTTLYSHSTLNSVFATTSAVSGWQTNSVILGAYTNQTVMFRFVANSNYGSSICNQGLDEFMIMDAPACAPPTALTHSNVTGYAATISWTAPSTGSPANYDWEVRTSGAAGSGTLGLSASGAVAAPTTSASVTGLVPTTSYSVYVKTDCGGSTYSSWSALNTFTTTVSCPAPTSFTVASVTPTTAVATWTPGGTESTWLVSYTAPTTTASVSSPSLALSGLTPSTNYTIQVRGYCGVGDTSARTTTSFMTPCLPPNITGTTPGLRCGIGTTTLGATADPGATIQWYTSSTGGTAVATGSVYTTPTISTTTNYYVTAMGGLSTTHVGLASTNGSQGTNTSGAYLIFDAYSNFTLNTVDIYPSGSGTGSVVIALQNSSGTTLQTATVVATGQSSAVAQTVPVNFNVTPGTGYRLNYLSSSGGVSALYRDYSGAVFPYTLPGVVSITNGSLSGYYYYFYNWSVSTGCESARTVVTASVTTPPVLTLSTPTTVCANVIETLSVTSNASDYDSYVWSPVTNLYSDAAATTPYTGASTLTVYYKSGVANTSTYTVNGQNSTSSCVNDASLIVSTDVPNITASISPSVVCSGSAVNLNAIYIGAVPGTATVGTQSTTDLTGGPFRSGAGSDNKVQYLITAAELQSAGIHAGNITSLSFSVTSLGSGTMPNWTLKTGTTTATSLGTTFDPSSLTTVYGPSSYTAVSGLNTFTFATAFNWDGVSNVIVQVCHDAVSSGSSYVAMTSSANKTTYAVTTGACSQASGTAYSTYRPVMILNAQVNGDMSSAMNWVWNPGAITTNTAVVNPVNTGTSSAVANYTVTLTNPVTSCTNSAVSSVTVNPLPTAPLSFNSTQCGVAVPTASVSGGTSYNWYATPTSTTSVQSGSSQTYTSSIGSTTTWYVASYSGMCESSTRTAVTASVNIPDAITASAGTASVCPNATLALMATQTGTTNTYSYTWNASPASGSGIATTVSGSSVVVTPTLPGSYVYSVTAIDGACTAVSNTTVYVFQALTTPPVTSASPNPLCAGSTASLNATVPTTVAIGAGSVTLGTSSSGGGLSPYSQYYEGQRTQYLFKASELTAAGMTSGNVAGVTFSVTAANATMTFTNYTVKMYGTTATDLASSYASASGSMTTVYGPSNLPAPAAGLNTINFATPFNWDGTSNVIMDICFENDPGALGVYYTNNSIVAATAISGYTPVRGDYADNSSLCNTSNTGSSATSANRPNVRFIMASTYNFSWTDGTSVVGTSNPVAVTPTVTTTYAAVITDANSCSINSAPVTVTVNPIPSVTIVPTSTAICSGTTATMTVSGATTYTWAPGNQSAATITVSPASTQVYTVTGSALGCTGTNTLSLTVNVTPTVTAATSNTLLCSATSVTLTASGATNYTWSPVAQNTATVIDMPATSTVYTVTGSSPAGCSNTRTVSVTVSATPTVSAVSSNSAICAGSSATLTAGGATTYSWSSGATTSSIVVTPGSSASYTVTGTNLCGTSTASTMVTVNAIPTVTAATSSATICAGETATLTASGASTYTWTPGNFTSASVAVTPTVTTTYSVIGATAGCSASTMVVQNVSPCTGIQEFSGVEVSVYPNPNHGQVTIVLPSELAGTSVLEVYDAVGKLVIREKLTTATTRINTMSLEDGLYLYKIFNNGQIVKINRMVKQ